MRSVTHMHIPFEVLSVVFHTNPSKWPLFRLNLEQFAKNISYQIRLKLYVRYFAGNFLIQKAPSKNQNVKEEKAKKVKKLVLQNCRARKTLILIHEFPEK